MHAGSASCTHATVRVRTVRILDKIYVDALYKQNAPEIRVANRNRQQLSAAMYYIQNRKVGECPVRNTH